MSAPPVAAVDCGTNSTRLLVADGDSRQGGLRQLDRRMRITRLGQGVDSRGELSQEAIERTVEVLAEYRKAFGEHGVELTESSVRAVATSAVRDAANRDQFLDAAEAGLGVRPEVLSGEQEASLSFLGATAELSSADGPFLVVDIGGGSTELVHGTVSLDGIDITGSVSLDVGCVRVTEQHLPSDPPRAEELSAALSVIELHMDDVQRLIPEAVEAKTLVGLAGTVSTAAAVEIGLPEYDRDAIHHFRLSKAAAEDVFRTLATETLDDRIHNPGLERQRADVIVGGLCILVQLMRSFGFDEMVVSEVDILDGIAMSLLSVDDRQ